MDGAVHVHVGNAHTVLTRLNAVAFTFFKWLEGTAFIRGWRIILGSEIIWNLIQIVAAIVVYTSFQLW